MKKQYIQPETTMVVVAIRKMVCASPNSNPQVGGTTSNEEDLLSREFRQRSVWDED